MMNMRMIGIRFGRLFDFLASVRLAVLLLVVLAALLAVYLLVPQDLKNAEAMSFLSDTGGVVERLARALGFTDVQHSYLLFGTYALLFVNLLLCVIRRFRVMVHLSRFPKAPPAVSPFWMQYQVECAGLGAEEVAKAVRMKGYRPLVNGNTIYGMRGRFCMLGHWVFHLGLLVLLVGGMWVAVRPDPFRGTVGVGEGEPFDLYRAPYLRANIPPSQDFPGLRFQMEKIEVLANGEDLRWFEARLHAENGDQVTIGINRPFRRHPYQVLVNGFGYMPGWVVADKRGRMLRGAWVKLVPFPLLEEDSFSIGPGGSTVSVRLLPDYQSSGKEARNRSHEFRNPRFETKIVWRGEKVFEGLLKPDQRVALGKGQEFFFLPEIRKYAMLDIMEEQGHEIVFAALAIMILGIVIRYVRIRKEVLVRVDGKSLHLFGRSEILETLFAEELEWLAEELAKKKPNSQTRRQES